MCSGVRQCLPCASAQPLPCAAGLCGHTSLQCSAGGLCPGLHNCCQPQCDRHSAQPHRCHALHCVAGGTGYAVVTPEANHCHSCGLDTATAHPTAAECQHCCWLSGLWAQVSCTGYLLAVGCTPICVDCSPGSTLLQRRQLISNVVHLFGSQATKSSSEAAWSLSMLGPYWQSLSLPKEVFLCLH